MGLADRRRPRPFVEQFVVASRDEHLRQYERVTRRDAERRAMIDLGQLAVGAHWLTSARGTLTSRFWTARASR
jgi:hypothetical protein